MAHFQAEAKKHSGFDLYGGLFNNRIFGSVKADGNSDRSQRWSKHNAGSYSPSAYSFSKDGADRQPVYNASLGQDMNKNSNGGTAEIGQGVNKNSKGETGYGGFAENGNSKGSVQNSDLGRLIVDTKENSDCKQESYTKVDTPQMRLSDFSDNSLRNSPRSDSFSLGRKSSDSSSCSSWGSGSGSFKGTSPGRVSPMVGNVKVSRNHSGELSTGSLSGESSNGGSPTAESRGRSSSVGNVLANGLGRAQNGAKTGNTVNSRATLGSVITGAGSGNQKLASCRSLLSKNDCPPSLKSGYSSSSSGELSSGNGNALPSGNKLPTGNILRANVKVPSGGKGLLKAEQVTTGHVLGSGNGKYGHGSIIRGNGKAEGTGNIQTAAETMILKRSLSSTNAEDVKNAGNEQYKKGHFAEALLLYDRAIALSPGHALYHSNKCAALTGLGLLAEAVKECQEAIRLDNSYIRAHQRLASLYLRLGEIENARTHFKLSGQQSDWTDIQKFQTVEMHLSKCAEARKIGDWKTVLKESNAAIMAGADSARQFFASKAEALLKLQRLDEAATVLMTALKIEVDASTRYFGIAGISYLLLVQTQVDMALGRFESAVASAERAARMDLYNHEVTALLRKARAVAYARSSGNALFKAGKFFEACTAYGEGLEHEPMNAVLICNRAACRSKLSQWEKAVEDCNAALSIQPNYTKALLRRADSNAKLERWEEALNDYEALRREIPGDVEVARSLFDVQVALKRSRGEETNNMKFGGEVEVVSSNDQFRKAITAPGLAVVHFSTRSSERCKQISPFVDQLCKRHPSVNFLKVDVEENLYLAKSENVSTVPTFKIYKNGLKVKEIVGPSQQLLEYSVKHYSL
jgi:tetratricopeptide (TPR) repeat protein